MGSVESCITKPGRLSLLLHMPGVVVVSESRVFSVATSFTVVLRGRLPVHLDTGNEVQGDEPGDTR